MDYLERGVGGLQRDPLQLKPDSYLPSGLRARRAGKHPCFAEIRLSARFLERPAPSVAIAVPGRNFESGDELHDKLQTALISFFDDKPLISKS